MGMLLYNGYWDIPFHMYNLTSTFNFSLAQPVGFYPHTSNASTNDLTLVQQMSSMECAPARALYTLDTIYPQGIRTLSYSTKYLDLLSTPFEGNRAPYRPEGICPLTNDTTSTILEPGCIPAALPVAWPANCLGWYRNANLMASFDSMLAPLMGNYSTFVSSLHVVFADAPSPVTPPTGVYELPNGDTELLDGFLMSAEGYSHASMSGPNETIIANTPSNTERANFSSEFPSITITPAQLNAAFANITISAAAHFGIWHTDTAATVTTWEKVYSLSSPLSLLLPYTLALLLTLPFLLLGANALRLNGVSASDGGFTQLLTTTTGSAAVERAAAGGCLGGSENVPKELATLKIRFGELSRSRGLVRRAGFGTEDEVEPLMRGAACGISAIDMIQSGQARDGTGTGTGFHSARTV